MSSWGCKTCNGQKKIGNVGLLLKFAIVHVPRKDRHRVMFKLHKQLIYTFSSFILTITGTAPLGMHSVCILQGEGEGGGGGAEDFFKRGNLPSPVLTKKAKCR